MAEAAFLSISPRASTKEIREWRSIVTLVVFVVTNILVLFPFTIPVPYPRAVHDGFIHALVWLRIIPPRHHARRHKSHHNEKTGSGRHDHDQGSQATGHTTGTPHIHIPINFITAPLIADLFLLAIRAIGRDEVRGGTLGANNIAPIDIMAFFITLAYIAISIDASGIIRYLAWKVLDWGKGNGHWLFFYLYAFFFFLGSFIGNDPIVLSGTAFLAYMTRVSKNITHPRAWIFTQFAVANTASAILVSSNPTNLVLAGAFRIKFINYTANMIVPVVVTIIVLFPFLLFILFNSENLIPKHIEMHELSQEAKDRAPINPNIPDVKADDQADTAAGRDNDDDEIPLHEIMNPFLDRWSAIIGSGIMGATLVTILVVNATSATGHEHPVFYITCPAAFLMFCWDIGFGWAHRTKNRQIALDRKAKEQEPAHSAETILSSSSDAIAPEPASGLGIELQNISPDCEDHAPSEKSDPTKSRSLEKVTTARTEQDVDIDKPETNVTSASLSLAPTFTISGTDGRNAPVLESDLTHRKGEQSESVSMFDESPVIPSMAQDSKHKSPVIKDLESSREGSAIERATLSSIVRDSWQWLQYTFPTATAVAKHLPFALVPFAFCMFVLVQGLVSKGWVEVFAHGWDHWVKKTGTIGAVGGMGFLSVVLCNFAGTNIGTTILLSRVIQSWEDLHRDPNSALSERTFWGTVYAMALGVNYGAFSAAFSASLAGLLWRDILRRKKITIGPIEFARTNFPIIAISMTVGCVVLVGQVYITIGTGPYSIERS